MKREIRNVSVEVGHLHTNGLALGYPLPGYVCAVCGRKVYPSFSWSRVDEGGDMKVSELRCETSIAQFNMPCPCHGAGVIKG